MASQGVKSEVPGRRLVHHVGIVIGQVCNARLEGCRNPIKKFHHKAWVMVDSGSASSCEWCKVCGSRFCGSAAVPKALADKYTRVPRVLLLHPLIKMKSVSMLNPCSV